MHARCDEAIRYPGSIPSSNRRRRGWPELIVALSRPHRQIPGTVFWMLLPRGAGRPALGDVRRVRNPAVTLRPAGGSAKGLGSTPGAAR